MRSPSPVVALLVSLVLAGCTFPWDRPEESAAPDPYAARGGPHALLVVENVGENVVNLHFRLLDAGGALAFEGRYEVAPSASDERALPLSGPGPHRLAILYSWGVGARAASGQTETQIDAAACPTVVRADVRIDTTPGATNAGATSTC